MSAIEKLIPSHLDPHFQMNGLGDIDLDAFHLEMRNKAGIELVESITDAQISRTIEGASALTVQIDDTIDRRVLRSGRLGRHVKVELDGLYFILVGVKKQGRAVTLTFEEQEVNVLRYYNKFIHAKRSKVTRAQFVLRMIQEVKEIRIKWIIPELYDKQPISDLRPGQILYNAQKQAIGDYTYDPRTTAEYRQRGFKAGSSLTVQGAIATPEQINNAQIVMATAWAMMSNQNPHKRKILVCTMMTAITESNIRNLSAAVSDRDSHGVFQQRPSQGWNNSDNVSVQTAEFVNHAISEDRLNPGDSYQMLCQNVQRSAFADGSNYAKWRAEAEAWVDAYGAVGAAGSGGGSNDQVAANSNVGTNGIPQTQTVLAAAYEYTRGTLSQDKQNAGIILTKEDSWACMQRLAGEVNWRAFVVSGTIYYISEERLFSAQSYMTLDEDVEGVDWIDFDYDEGKRSATVTLTVHLTRWSAPPGSTVTIVRSGIIDGKWIVNTAVRSLYDHIATVTLKKPQPILPEPIGGTSSNLLNTFDPPKVAGAANGLTEAQGNAIQQKVVAYAYSQLGVAYVWGADNPGVAFDCSGLTEACYNSVGIGLPHNAQAQYDAGPKVPGPEALQLGDLVYFAPSPTGAISHVGIYVGNGKMIDAPHPGANVRVDEGWRPMYGTDYYVGATRPWQT